MVRGQPPHRVRYAVSRPKWACPLGQYHPRQVEHRSRDAGLRKHVVDLAAMVGPVAGLHPNFPPVISRVRRLFRPSWGVSFVVVVSCSSQFFRPPFTL